MTRPPPYAECDAPMLTYIFSESSILQLQHRYTYKHRRVLLAYTSPAGWASGDGLASLIVLAQLVGVLRDLAGGRSSRIERWLRVDSIRGPRECESSALPLRH